MVSWTAQSMQHHFPTLTPGRHLRLFQLRETLRRVQMHNNISIFSRHMERYFTYPNISYLSSFSITKLYMVSLCSFEIFGWCGDFQVVLRGSLLINTWAFAHEPLPCIFLSMTFNSLSGQLLIYIPLRFFPDLVLSPY